MYGGIYADLDVECLKPLDEVLAEGDIVVGRMGSDFTNPHSIPNATMASKARQAFWLLPIDLIESGPGVQGPTRIRDRTSNFKKLLSISI